jgi:L-lactate dehydrogenase (cytochrome)/(S)-mandelate dehydrogenase
MELEKRAYNAEVLRVMARRRLPRMVFDFIDGGAEDELTRGRNEADFSEIEFVPQPLMGTSTRDLSIELFGQRLSLPVLIGPTGLSGMVWPNGEVHAAEAANDAGTIYTMSHASTVTIEDLANRVAVRRQLHLRQHFGQAHGKRLVQHDAERAALAVLADQRHGMREMRVVQAGHGDQQLIGQ